MRREKGFLAPKFCEDERFVDHRFDVYVRQLFVGSPEIIPKIRLYPVFFPDLKWWVNNQLTEIGQAIHFNTVKITLKHTTDGAMPGV